MEVLDGNAIAGDLYEVFGRDVTSMTGTCEHCGRPSMVAELVVYGRAPGTVVRCPHCGSVVMVLVQIAASTRMTMDRFSLLETHGRPPGAHT